jgi:hypothetical protein
MVLENGPKTRTLAALSFDRTLTDPNRIDVSQHNHSPLSWQPRVVTLKTHLYEQT